MSRYRRSDLAADFGYTPGEQPADDSDWLKLNTNESPLPPSTTVAPAIVAAAAQLDRYPDPFAEPLRSALAEHHGVAPEQVVVANGADEVLDCCFRAFVAPGDTVVYPWPTYSVLPILSTLFAARPALVPLADDHSVPPAVGVTPATLRVLVNPNAPTGVWLAPDTVADLVGNAPGVVLIDEAYADFAPASCLPLLTDHENWMIVRTFSKSYALAGLRVGYAIASTALIADLYAVKESYPVDRCAIAGAAAALRDQDHHRAVIDTVTQQRERLTQALRQRGWEVLPSAANFVFASPPGGDAAGVAERLRAAHILVRRFTTPPRYANHLRISVGSPPSMSRLLAALDGHSE